MSLSSFASKPIEEVVAANPQTFFQAYWVGTREQMVAHIERARTAGAVGLILTLDWTFSNGRDWGSPAIPERIDLKTMVRVAPETLMRPRWLLGYAKTGRVPDLMVPNMAVSGEPAPTLFGAYGEWMRSPLPTWDDVRWLGEQWGGPFMIKGVTRVDDAKRAVDAGVTAISVSNHGGNDLDGTPATIRALPAVAEAVGGQVEVLLDGGIRRGGDVVKAVGLGARAVMIGRAYLWGLAANGQAGVENVLDILRGGIDSALLGLGRPSIYDLTPEDLVIPARVHPQARCRRPGRRADPQQRGPGGAGRMTLGDRARRPHRGPRLSGWPRPAPGSLSRSAPPSSTGRRRQPGPARYLHRRRVSRAPPGSPLQLAAPPGGCGGQAELSIVRFRQLRGGH
jgi:L-lactate dehydrogenase (cytochrome)/glycolate oxidase